MSSKSTLDISEVIQRSGLPASTLRFYEEKGLIESVGRRGLHRLFDESVLERLALIGLGQMAGFTLAEIGTLLTPNPSTIDREQLSAKADELDKTITRMITMRDGLRHVAECTAPSHMECDKFQQLLRVAVKDQHRKNRQAAKSV